MIASDKEKTYPKRFYKTVTVQSVEDRFAILLDGKSVKTPGKRELYLPNEPLASAICSEWDVQGERLDPESMILTKLANTAIDRVQPRKNEIIADLLKYISSDLLCYRAESPKELVERQNEKWSPILGWAEHELAISLKITSGILHVDQSQEAIDNAQHHISEYDAFILSGLHNMTTLLGSAILSLAHLKGHIDLDHVWSVAHVDEDWQSEHWGVDEEAHVRREKRFVEMQSISRFLKLANDV